ncbi:MAG: VIT1/CCC1 transporter family protein [Acidimicrobiia bacterium]|nr:VIT1/CCC1 transporter family protein [Acidimicrobiia bacterium]
MATAPDTPASAEEVPYRPHVGPTRQYLRDIILGVNDGLVSIFLLVVGVVGGGLAAREILLAGIAASVAGAISMSAGEYIATKSQEELFDSEEELEREHLLHHRDIEREEIREMFGDMGLRDDLVEDVVDALDGDDETFLRVMMALEFGVVDEERRNPYLAAAFSGLLFLAGSLPSILPFFFVESTGLGLWIAAAGSGVGLFAVGVAKTVTTRKPWLLSGLENVAIAAAGAGLSYLIGSLFDTYV